MALTLQERNTCRDLLDETKFRMLNQDDEVVSTNNRSIVRFIEGIAEPLQDQCQQFLKTFVSAKNPEVVIIIGTTSPYDVSGEYFGTGSLVNGYDVRKKYGDDYWLQVSKTGSNYRWVIINEWNDVLYQSNEQADSPVAIGSAIWGAVEVSFQMSSAREGMVVPEVAIVVDDTATFTSTGNIISGIQLPTLGVYALVIDPLADIQVRDGTWRGGRVWTELQKDGTFTLFQALYVLNESAHYILSGKTITAYHTEERRLYERIPEANVGSLINSLSVLSGYTIVDTDARLTNNRGIYNVSLRLRSYTGPVDSSEDPHLIGHDDGLSPSDIYIIRHVAESEVEALVTELKSLDLIKNVRASASNNEGFWDVTYSVLVSINEDSHYILSGKTVTSYHTEERRLYERIPEANINDLIDSLISLSGYSVIDTDVRLTSNKGIYNVSLRLRSYTGPEDTTSSPHLVGYNGGLFQSNVYLIRHVAESAVEALVTELKALDLIQNVRTSASSSEGFWDVTYSQLVLPAVRTEEEVSYERRDKNAWEIVTDWKYFENYTPVRDFEGNIDHWEEFLDRRPEDYYRSGDPGDARRVDVTTMISYSASDPGSISYSFSWDTSVSGRKRRLANGIWEKQQITIHKPWWWN